jgi:hypothetical protein
VGLFFVIDTAPMGMTIERGIGRRIAAWRLIEP